LAASITADREVLVVASVNWRYANPHGTQIGIAVIAHLATGPGPASAGCSSAADHQSHLHRQAKAPQPSVPQGQSCGAQENQVLRLLANMRAEWRLPVDAPAAAGYVD
jgi:hypothetical protein